jgi:hypothetical protein
VRGVRWGEMLVLTLQYMLFCCFCDFLCAALVPFVMAAHDSHLQRHKDALFFWCVALHYWSVVQTAVKRTCHACCVSANFTHTFPLQRMLQHTCTSDADNFSLSLLLNITMLHVEACS